MTNFERCDAIVAGIEAGYVWDAADPGGETKYGISKKAYPDEDIKNLTLQRAQFLRKRDYWGPHNLDALEYGKALLVYDCAINGGNHARWYSMFGGEPLAAFARDFQAERTLYLASLAGWLHDGRGWARRLFTMHAEALKP